MINDQEYITTKLKKTLEKMIPLSSKRLNNLVAMIIGIIISKTVVLSEKLKSLKIRTLLAQKKVKLRDFKDF
ncbi:hypothetical protein [Clostridium weizhouense]|uniref:Transposase n=1 Tax=Clostridium weizhouense TaxID=2859781 RepID=A0ABS7ASI5_9CLOT|nr:hypothetical protein [Clostridium weizhouense]MBW6411635.1 hypothetical protein [Clostridium weizhouense]